MWSASFQVLVLQLLLIGSLVLPLTLTQILTLQDAEALLKKHNEYRRQEPSSNMYLLHWNVSLQQRADAWAQRCLFKHERNMDLGENLYFDTDHENDVFGRGMDAWHQEKSNWGYTSQSCARACHYTQLIWGYTTTVGCSANMCPALDVAGRTVKNAMLLVCYYYPRGNFMGNYPYAKGRSCSECAAGDSCSKNLCVSSGPVSKLAPDYVKSLVPLTPLSLSMSSHSFQAFTSLTQQFTHDSAHGLHQETHHRHEQRHHHYQSETVMASGSQAHSYSSHHTRVQQTHHQVYQSSQQQLQQQRYGHQQQNQELSKSKQQNHLKSEHQETVRLEDQGRRLEKEDEKRRREVLEQHRQKLVEMEKRREAFIRDQQREAEVQQREAEAQQRESEAQQRRQHQEIQRRLEEERFELNEIRVDNKRQDSLLQASDEYLHQSKEEPRKQILEERQKHLQEIPRKSLSPDYDVNRPLELFLRPRESTQIEASPNNSYRPTQARKDASIERRNHKENKTSVDDDGGRKKENKVSVNNDELLDDLGSFRMGRKQEEERREYLIRKWRYREGELRKIRENHPHKENYVVESTGRVCVDRNVECPRWAVICDKSIAVRVVCELTCGRCGLHLNHVVIKEEHTAKEDVTKDNKLDRTEKKKRKEKTERQTPAQDEKTGRQHQEQGRDQNSPSSFIAQPGPEFTYQRSQGKRQRLKEQKKRERQLLREQKKRKRQLLKEQRRRERQRLKQARKDLCRDDPKHVRSCKYWAKKEFCRDNELINNLYCRHSCGACR